VVSFANQDNHGGSVLVTSEGCITRIRMARCPVPPSDATINAVHRSITEALEQNPGRILLDLSGCTRADSRVVALTCEAIRECAAKGVTLQIRSSHALRAWLFVYRIPLLNQVAPGGRRAQPAAIVVTPP